MTVPQTVVTLSASKGDGFLRAASFDRLRMIVGRARRKLAPKLECAPRTPITLTERGKGGILDTAFRGVAQMEARCVWDAEVAGSSPAAPTAGVAKWYCPSLPSCCCGFDSHRPLSPFGYQGPIAQRSEQPAHNRSVPGSNPGGPTLFLAGAWPYHLATPFEVLLASSPRPTLPAGLMLATLP
jgi:hypothetical protein